MAVGCRYDSAGPWDRGRNCSNRFTPGAEALGEHLQKEFGGSYGGYSCRPNTADASQMSVHGTGRAIDFFQQAKYEGDAIARLLVDNHEKWGIQQIIWWYRDWRCDSGWTYYGGPVPHTDHLHIELTIPAAANNTAQTYGGNMPLTANDLDQIRNMVQNNADDTEQVVRVQADRIKAEIEQESRATRRAILDYEEAVVSVTGADKAAIRAKLQPATLQVINVVD
jgi:plasmid stability protein